MRLQKLINAIPVPSLLVSDCDINQIRFHSKQIEKGDLYVAIPGYTTDGHDYIDEAVAAGACAVVGERDITALHVPYIKVSNARLALAKMSAELYGHPYKKHAMFGITGTNGKTTTAHMIRHVLEHAGESCSLFGTVERYINGVSYPSNMTTGDAVRLQQWLCQSNDQNVVMEVSSHGLAQNRVEGIRFDYALFTNLSHEHLDYHTDMEQYFQSKERLFHLLKENGEAVVNSNDAWGRRLAEKLNGRGVPVSTYGHDGSDTLQLLSSEKTLQPTVQVREKGEIYTFMVPLPGTHNIWNAMAAVLLARRKGIPFPKIIEALKSFPGVSGRFETYNHPNGAVVVVDYAHTPDGLLQCLETVSVYKPRRLVHIFGFRGKRDDSKWGIMLDISRRYCDKTILTTDDLNGVSEEEMLDRYERLKRDGVSIIADRTMAISCAWNEAVRGDCILISGKGPETYQSSFQLPTESDPETIRHLQKERIYTPVFLQ